MRKSLTYKLMLALAVLGLVVISACSGAPGGSSAAATPRPTSAVVKSSGQIVAEGTVLPVQGALLSFATSGGVVEEILIKEGEPAEKGDVIARLQGSEKARAAVAAAELELLNSQQALKDLNDTADLVKAQNQLTVAKAQKALTDAIKWRKSYNLQRAGQNTIDLARANYFLAKDAVDKAESNFDRVKNLDEDDINYAAALSAMAAARAQLDVADANLKWVEDRPDNQEVSESDGKIAVAQAQLDEATRNWEKTKNGPDADKLALAEGRVKNAQAQLDSAESVLRDLELRAPFNGMVLQNKLKVGELVSAGINPVAFADVTNWRVETTDLTELNVVKVQEGQPVTVTLDAIPGLELTGKVTSIQSYGVSKQGDITYTIGVTLDQQDARLRWNMTASVIFQ